MKYITRYNVANRLKLYHRRLLHIQRHEKFNGEFDVLVVGGGHAGIEAAAASARCGARTLLLTQNAKTIGLMPCNPSFGGIGKGHLVREVDALDGVCARICDQSAITYNALNRSQGPAVLGLRAQIDRHRYPQLIQDEILNKTPNLFVLETSVDDLIIEKGVDGRRKVGGCVTNDGMMLKSDAVIVTTGTFLNAEIFCGSTSKPAGRKDENASYALANTFKQLGLELGRLRTGTPPRIDARTVDFSKFNKNPPDANPIYFSFMTEKSWIDVDKQLPTYIGFTDEKLAKIVQENVNKNRYYVGSEVNAPRYCPSLESKVVRFPELSHRFYLEHEGLESNEIYMQGLSMNFEPHAQVDVLRTIDGLEQVEMTQPGYGVAYDFVNPRQLNSDLSVKALDGLYLAGQINGTTGYEEAASQGIIAGINSAWLSNKRKGKSQPLEPLKIDRSQAYIGVLIDDLTSLGTNEPYRMFTSRVEFRLHLRPDNADLRLTEIGHKYGAVSNERYSKFIGTKQKFDKTKTLLESIEMPSNKWCKYLPSVIPKPRVRNAHQILGYYNLSLNDLYAVLPDELCEIRDLIDDKDLEHRLKCDVMYATEQQRLTKKMDEVRAESNAQLPDDLNYLQMNNLNMECREKLDRLRPANLAAASRIDGITPEALLTLLRFSKNQKQRESLQFRKN